MSMAKHIEQKLKNAFKTERVHVVDESHKHAGHVGSRPGGETHFSLTVVSQEFASKPRVKRHQMVYAVLEQELKDSIHALSLSLLTPEEQQRKDEHRTEFA